MKRTNIYLDERNHRLLRIMAVEQETTMSALIRFAIDEFLKKGDKQNVGKQSERKHV
jgi:hypothetical protein